jgi:hypothetical protein
VAPPCRTARPKLDVLQSRAERDATEQRLSLHYRRSLQQGPAVAQKWGKVRLRTCKTRGVRRDGSMTSLAARPSATGGRTKLACQSRPDASCRQDSRSDPDPTSPGHRNSTFPPNRSARDIKRDVEPNAVPSVPMTMRHRAPGSLPLRAIGETSTWSCPARQPKTPCPPVALKTRKAVER